VSEQAPQPSRWPKGPWVIHPLLVGIPAILDFTYSNRGRVDPSQALYPIALTAGVALLLTLLLSLPLKSVARAGLMVSLLVIGFHHHDHVLSAWRIPMWVGIALGCMVFARWRWSLDVPTTFANLFVGIAICFPAYELISYQLQPHDPVLRADYLETLSIEPTQTSDLPNIYFILLDGYGREDVILSRYGLKNPLNEKLRELGFYIAAGAHSNYGQTAVSLAATLNLDYIDSMIEVKDPLRARYRLTFKRLIERNRTTETLKRAGYRIASYLSEYSVSQLDDVDVSYAPWLRFTEFEYLLANNTALLPATKLLGLPKSWVLHAIRRHQIQWVFDHLEAAETRPTFTFVHIVAPHPPFVFEPDGSYRPSGQKLTFADGSAWITIRGSSEEDYAEGYLAQLQYTNHQLIPALSRIIAKDPQAAIFLLSDHGPGKGLDWSSAHRTDIMERLAIQLAVRLPNQRYDSFYDSMTSVNAFRAFFNEVLGTQLPLLEDHSYFMRWSRPCQFVNVDAKLREEAPAAAEEPKASAGEAEAPEAPAGVFKLPWPPWRPVKLRKDPAGAVEPTATPEAGSE
jgi:hypothetical protein